MSASGESSILFVLAGYDRGFLLLIQEAFCSRLALVGVGARVGRASGQASLRTVLDGQFRLNDHAGSLDGGLEDLAGNQGRLLYRPPTEGQSVLSQSI